VQDCVADHHGSWLRWADWLAGPVDDRLWLALFRRTRSDAWDDARAIQVGASTPSVLEHRVYRRARALGMIPL
jgi:hypothetical protein